MTPIALGHTAVSTARAFGDATLRRRQVLFVGLNPKTLEASRLLGQQRSAISDVIGFVDEPSRIQPGVRYLGGLEAFANILRDHVVDVVHVGLPLRSHYDDVRRVIQICETHGVPVQLPANPFHIEGATSVRIEGGVPTMTLHTAPRCGFAMRLKFLLDRLTAPILMLLAAPLLLLAALAIKLDDRGPIFFTQDRVGYNKRTFRMLKLRTMAVGAEAQQRKLEAQNQRDGAAFKVEDDPRISRVGRVLRKYSLDELPQLWNVLVGDMSLVGPRPLSLRDYNLLPEDWQRRRFSMRPGLTCYWQVRGRHHTTFLAWMQMDLEYIDRWSLVEDLKILLATVPEVLRGGGA